MVNRSGSRIVGGQQTETNEYPWHAGIEWPGENRPRWVNTPNYYTWVDVDILPKKSLIFLIFAIIQNFEILARALGT